MPTICCALKLFAATHTARLWEPPSIQIICGALKLFAKEHCDSRVASAHSNYLRHAQIICCRSHCTAAESLFVQIICKALTLFEAAPPCLSNRALRVLRSVLRYAFIVLRVPPPPCVGTCVGMRSLVLRSPAPGRVLGGVMQREMRCFCPPHMTRKTQKERAAASAPHTFRSRNAETQKRVAGRAGTDGVNAGRQLQHVRSKVLPSPSYYGTVLDGAAGSSTGSAGRAS